MSDLYCPFCLSALPDQQTPCCSEVGHGATLEQLATDEASLRRINDEVAADYEGDNTNER